MQESTVEIWHQSFFAKCKKNRTDIWYMLLYLQGCRTGHQSRLFVTTFNYHSMEVCRLVTVQICGNQVRYWRIYSFHSEYHYPVFRLIKFYMIYKLLTNEKKNLFSQHVGLFQIKTNIPKTSISLYASVIRSNSQWM